MSVNQVAGLYRGAAGRGVEGPRSLIKAIPLALPAGFLGCSINEGNLPGSAIFQPGAPPATPASGGEAGAGEITLRGSGEGVWDQAGGFYFLCQPVAGDCQLTVTALTRPTGTDDWAQAGLMIRESMEAGARQVCLLTTARSGLQYLWRATTDDWSYVTEVMPHAALKLPRPPLRGGARLRLTRRGDTITAEYSRARARTFQPAGAPVPFDAPLPQTLSVGLVISANDASKISEAKFSDLAIQKH